VCVCVCACVCVCVCVRACIQKFSVGCSSATTKFSISVLTVPAIGKELLVRQAAIHTRFVLVFMLFYLFKKLRLAVAASQHNSSPECIN